MDELFMKGILLGMIFSAFLYSATIIICSLLLKDNEVEEQ